MKITTRKQAKAAKRNRYYTGEQCKRGHISERWAHSGSCIECEHIHNRIAQKKRYAEFMRLRTAYLKQKERR